MNDNEPKSDQAGEKCSACGGAGRILGPVKLGFVPKITPPVCTKCNGTGVSPKPRHGDPTDDELFLCPVCAGTMMLVRTTPNFGGFPKLLTFRCLDCKEAITIEDED